MPQGQPAWTENVPGKPGATAASPTNAVAEFAKFIQATLAQKQAAGGQAPSAPGAFSPAQPMAPPGQLATPPPGSTAPNAMSAAPQAPVSTPMPTSSPVGGGPLGASGFNFPNSKAAQGATAASALDSIAKAIYTSRENKRQDEVTHAQNTLNMFQNALAQGDMQTANLLATDPKIVKQWEKYLKMEFPRVPGAPPVESPMGVGPIAQPSPPTGGQAPLGQVNQPGGLGVARDMRPDSQIHNAMSQSVLDAIKSGKLSPQDLLAQQIGASAYLTPEENKQAARASMGIGLTADRQAQLDGALKQYAIDSMKDIVKIVTEQQMMGARELALQGKKDTAAETRTRITANATLNAVRERFKALAKLQDSKGEKLNTGFYETLIRSDTALANTFIPRISDPKLSDDEHKAAQAQYDLLTGRIEGLKKAYSGYQTMMMLQGMDEAKPDAVVATPEQ